MLQRFDDVLTRSDAINTNRKQDRLCIVFSTRRCPATLCIIYYMEESVLLGAKPLVDSTRHFIREPSGVFSVCHFCECRIVQ